MASWDPFWPLGAIGHQISALHSQSKLDAMVWSNILLIVSTSLQSKGSALASFSWQFNSEATIYTHASVPGCSAPNTLLLPATASQRKGSSLAALAWQRGQHVDRHQSIWTLSSQHPSSCFHCLTRQVLRLGWFLLASGATEPHCESIVFSMVKRVLLQHKPQSAQNPIAGQLPKLLNIT